jgi:hypothetical protein
MASTQTNTTKLGIVRVYALVFGIAYLAVAATEAGLAIFGSGVLSVGGETILRVTPVQNAIHWLVGAVVLGSFFAGNAAAKVVARTVGVVFVLVTALGFLARDLTGTLLGFGGPLPWSYNLVHPLTAAAALFAGFAAEAAYKERREVRAPSHAPLR